jgi:hypothetical protein
MKVRTYKKNLHLKKMADGRQDTNPPVANDLRHCKHRYSLNCAQDPDIQYQKNERQDDAHGDRA